MALVLKRKRKTLAEKIKIAELAENYTAISVAEEMNCSETYVYSCYQTYGTKALTPVIQPELVPAVLPEPAISKPNKAVSSEKKAMIIEMRLGQKLPFAEIAKRMGIHANTIYKILRIHKQGTAPTHKAVSKPVAAKVSSSEPKPDLPQALEDMAIEDAILRLHKVDHLDAASIADKLDIGLTEVLQTIKQHRLYA